MRTILLAGAAALALSVAPALAGSHAGSGGLINKSANAAGGSNSASTGGSAGNGDGNTHVSVSHSLDGNTLNSDNTSNTHNTTTRDSDNTTTRDSNNTTTTVQGNSGAGSLLGNSASATDGGTAVNAALGSYDVSDKTLSVSHTSTRTTDIIAQASANGSVNNNHTEMEKAGFSGLSNSMTDSVNGQGILSAQQNTGANALQQVTVSLGSVVSGGTGFGAATNSAH